MSGRIIVVDDDPLIAELTTTLLKDAGYDVLHINESLKALDLIKQNAPTLVLLDILMPGIDGLTLCHKIKNDPEMRGIKVAIVSGKAYHADKQRAIQYGADIFIEKPYNLDTFAGQITDLLSGKIPSASAAAAASKINAPADARFDFTIWGCRSLSPFKSAHPSRYGRRTPCVSLSTNGPLFIFDAGSGIIPLGEELIRSGAHKELWLCLTHFHQDHWEGLSQFACAYDPSYKINIIGANEPDQSLQDQIKRIFENAPPQLGPVQAGIQLYEMIEQTYEIMPGVRLAAFFANHPGTTLGYIFEAEERKFVYAPDSEVYGEHATALQDYDERLGNLCQGADILIHDGRYLDSDYPTRKNNGHSSWLSILDVAGRSQVKNLVIFHHDDDYSDATLDSIDAQARKIILQKNYTLDFNMAREGLKIAF